MDGKPASIAFALKKANISFLFPTKLHSYPSLPFLLPTKKTNSLFRQNFKPPNEKAFKVEAETRALTRHPPPPPRELDAMEPPKPETNHESLAPNGDSAVGVGGAPNGSGLEAQVPTTELTVTTSGNGKKSVHWSPDLVTESTFVSSPHESRFNPHSYFSSSFASSSSTSYSESSSSFSFIETVVTVKSVLGRWGKKVGEATRKAENLAGNTWQHLKTSPSFTEAAMGRIAQGTKVLAEGGYEKIFLQTFEPVPEERLQNSFACYLSTSAGPVMGVLYISTAKVAYSSDNPISYQSGSQTEWSYYKVVIPLHELKAVNPSSNTANPAEKYIQVISVDNHEFWFMGFLNYEGAVDCLQAALQTGKSLLCEA